MNRKDVLEIARNRKYQWTLVFLILFVVLIWSSSIRLSNWDLLTDSTSGEKIPLALDPYYFLRLSEEMIDNGGSLPEIDSMRYPSSPKAYSAEILPNAVVLMWKLSNIFGEYTLREVNVFSPVAFYFLGMVLFFFISYALTRSKITATIASIFLAFVPSYLYRTMAGFSDHEAIGMVSFFAAMLIFILALKYLDKKDDLVKVSLFALIVGALTSLTIASWGGISNFLFMIIPASFLLWWIVKSNGEGKDFVKKGILFYVIWLIATPLTGWIWGYDPSVVFKGFMLSTSSLLSMFVIVFILIDYFLMNKKPGFVKSKYREAYSFVISAILGFVGLSFLGKSILDVLKNAWIKIFHPWGVERVSLTVAENAQPFLVDWISQVGNSIFWMFFMGMIVVGIELSRGISKKKDRFLFSVFWTVMVLASLFSRISAASLMNGTNILSQIVYIVGLLGPLGAFVWIYFKNKVNWKPELIILASWMFFTLLSGRAAQRMFFAITPFMCLLASYVIFKVGKGIFESKDEAVKPILGILLVVLVLFSGFSVYEFEKGISQQASMTGPSAHYQWQGAMSWVRNNTNEGDRFVHWWDYGYWVEYLGERPALTDGGHAIGYWDHLIGRYLLTTPEPETAYSFMKTHNVSYLLIDPTDLGKYPAYSRIGSDETGSDRYSAIPVMGNDPIQTVETSNSTRFVYSGGYFVDEDIVYNINGRDVLLPQDKAAIAGVVLELEKNGNDTQFKQPIAFYVFNKQQYPIPMRYLYIEGKVVDFGSGLDAVARVVPGVSGNQLNPLGAVIYLSPKVKDGLFAQIYLMDDPFNNYKGLKLVHSEDEFFVKDIKSKAGDVGEFAYYNGFRGPIKIWEVEYPNNTLVKQEFLSESGDWAEFDNLEFVK